MAMRKIVTISITPEQDAFVRGRVECGRFGSVSEVMRAGLRLLEQCEASYDRESRRPRQSDAAHHQQDRASGTQ